LDMPRVDIDLSEDPPPFHAEQFIGLHKKFPVEDVGNMEYRVAHAALLQVLAVPTDIRYLPHDDLPIRDFVSMTLPPQSYTPVLSKPRTWYSSDMPTTDVACLASRPIPHKDFLCKLEKEAGQALFDGCKSILDPRYNEGQDRFPLRAITYWKRMEEVVNAHRQWETSVGWVDGQLAKPDLPEQDREALTVTKGLFETLGWNTVIWGRWTHLHLATLLSWQWLTDDHIDMMMTDLSARVAADPELSKTVLVAPLAFSNALKAATKYGKADAPLLARYEAHIKKHGFKRLYFPDHLNKNHWIAGRIDFERELLGTGDSHARRNAVPKTLIQGSKRWLKSRFDGTNFTYQGDSMDHGDQKDSTSCGIIAPNTIAADIFGEKIWEQQHAAGARASSFIRLAHSPAIRTEVSWESYSNPIPPATSPDEDFVMDDVDEPAGEVYTGDHGDVEDDGDDVMDVVEPGVELVEGGKKGGDAGSVSDASAVSRKTLAGFLGFKSKVHDAVPTKKKRAREDIDESADLDAIPKSKRTKQANGTGTSKSATAGRKDTDAYKSGTLTPQTADQKKLDRWKAKLVKDDVKVEFHPTDVLEAKHSVCGEYVRMDLPYQAAKWNLHMNKLCPVLHQGKRKDGGKGRQSLKGVPSLFGWIKPLGTAAPHKPRRSQATEPCPGLTAADSAHLPGYLQRTGAPGGGGRSVTVIAKEKFGKLFRRLGSRKKKIVSDTQYHEHRWRNDHSNLRVFSTGCKKEVVSPAPGSRTLPCSACSALLNLKNFKQAIRRPASDDKNYIYVNDKYRNQLLGHLYAKAIGLKEIIETSDAKNTPCIKFAQGTLQGKYTDFEVFEGLVEAMVMKTDKLERGVGMQNFKYPPAWDELCHIIKIHSPSAARALGDHFQVRSERSFRTKEAREPRFPMEIGDRTFTLVEEHLAALDYHGPVNLSCDDTKLFPGLRMYHDAKEKVDYLVGAIQGPIRVADPEAMKAVLEDANVMKATKVRVWCLSVPLPKIMPLVVAAIPIPNSMTAAQLLIPLEKILYGLLDRGTRVVSYAADGTETERLLQRMLLDKADRNIKHTISNPISGAPDTVIEIGVFRTFPIVMIQDSKHALKTFRNNLFSGARMLTFGNFTAIFRRIYQMAMSPDSPLFERDVNRALDRQDDAAATRLFCSETLAYLTEQFPEHIGEIVYLFVFGELVDSYQNREISHSERIKMALRARYFLDAWARFLDVAGYKKAQYFISREAIDITRIIIEGIIGLIIVHRDHVPDNFPLLPWFHSTEPCEHTFGSSRKVVKDFTFLDFIYMVPKVRIAMRQAVLAAKSSDPKARAQGYSHTYYDNTGANLLTLAVYPSDAEIAYTATLASAEADALVSLLGLDHEKLYRKQLAPFPSIDTWYDEDVDLIEEEFDDINENRPSDAEELQALIDEQEREDAPIHGKRVTEEIMSLTCASIALAADEHMRVQEFQQIDEEELDDVAGEEYTDIQRTLTSVVPALPQVQLPDEASKPFGQGYFSSVDTIDFSSLVSQRQQHETKHAKKCTRTKTTKSLPEAEVSIRRQILHKYQELLKESEKTQAAGTSVERRARWNMAPITTGAGNSANAAVAASAVASKVRFH
ncbi:hypothetical protein C8F04DRAFT_949367, partial [Mycena alexandri]